MQHYSLVKHIFTDTEIKSINWWHDNVKHQTRNPDLYGCGKWTSKKVLFIWDTFSTKQPKEDRTLPLGINKVKNTRESFLVDAPKNWYSLEITREANDLLNLAETIFEGCESYLNPLTLQLIRNLSKN